VKSIVETQMNPITEIFNPNILNSLGIARHCKPRQVICHQGVRRQKCFSKFFLRLLIIAHRAIEHRPIVAPPGAPLAIIVRALVALGDQVLASQERKLQPWNIPLTGYFYTSPKRENLFHRLHVSQEQEPIIALIRLCKALPNHDKWMKWYSAVVLHCIII